MSALDLIKKHPLPFAELMGVTFIKAEPDEVVATMTVRPDLCTAGGIVHGGALMALADTVGAAATFIYLPAGAKGTTTIESKTNFLGAGPAGEMLTATATPVHKGARTQVWQTRITRADGRAVALVTQTQMVL